MENQLDNIFKVSFDEIGRDHLKKIAQWAKIAAICTFVGYGVALLTAIFNKTPAALAGDEGVRANSLIRGSSIAAAVLVTIIGVAINYFLYKFSVDAGAGVANLDQQKLTDGLRSLKTYFKIFGIIMIIAFSIGVLVFIFAILFSLNNH